MKINSFTAKNVHGYLNFKIDFFSDVTFLIGINGSGKTSALKLILGLTSPSFDYLNQIKYEHCEVICSSNEEERDIIIRSDQNKEFNEFRIFFKYKNEEYTSDNILRIFDYDETVDFDEYYSKRQRHKEEFDNLQLVKKIREIATPKFLGLDRRIYEGRFIDHRFNNRRSQFRSPHRKAQLNYLELSAIDSSLEEVQTLIFYYIRKIAQRQPQISEEFKKKIFKQSFNFVTEHNFDPIPSNLEIIQERRDKVTSAVTSLGIDYLNHDIKSFFDKIESVVNDHLNYLNEKKDIKDNQLNFDEEYLKILSAWFNNGTQLKRIDEIINYSQQYQKEITELRTPLKKLEDITSNFLKEGGKSLIISSDGEIKVKLKNNLKVSVYELSSGEKQIIIMIAHLIFEESRKPSGIFIIDEPELSLHIAWQEIFVDSISTASPKTQFILATHSPSIVSKVEREKNCQDLNK
ncbi:AAA family ATPase [Leptospira meyeri]|uniref:AAA family ATPase n=1 Tax=Leptospira meyeri TaxID=29508 RepID=UPI000C2AF03C|nr:AAA family ATPase [Leptospira meyeri]PJZ79219.1 hypothetical protein CH359_19210 [Leptospira meyeri]